MLSEPPFYISLRNRLTWHKNHPIKKLGLNDVAT